MLYAVTALALLTLPGLSITLLTGIRHSTFLFSISLSYALFVLVLKLGQSVGMSVAEVTQLYFILVATLLVLTIVIRVVIPTVRGIPLQVFLNRHISIVRPYLAGVVAIVVSLSCYYLYAGAYLELPSDIFQHMEYVQNIGRQLENSAMYGSPIPSFYLQINGKFWHYFYALVNSWTGSDLADSITAASFVNNLLFLLGVFSFSIVVFGRLVSDSRALVLVSLAVCMFTFLHFGVSIFSFMRYYAMAPVMLNMILYFTIMAVVIRFFQDDGWQCKEIFLVSLIAYAGLHIHIQEVLFAAVMVLLMSGYLFVRETKPVFSSLIGRRPGVTIPWVQCISIKPAVVFLSLALATIALHIYSFLRVSRNPVEQPKLISLGEYLPFADSLFILNPSYQFYQVVGIWGLFVIVLFFINWNIFRSNAYLVAGMLSPVFTVFNPVFVDLFLHHSHSIMLWRLSFLVPVYLVGGFFLYRSIEMIREGSGRQLAYYMTVIILLLVLLLPMKLPGLELPTSRMTTLDRVDPKASPQHWSDLLDFLDTINERKIIITDPVTGYMVTALSRHTSPRYKFHRAWGGYVNFDLEDYSNHPFDRYAGRLLIINRRNGAMSDTGRLARHWPEGILQLDSYYENEKLDEYIESQPERFELLWGENRIRVFRIRKG